MKTSLIISLIGPDRTGLVESVARVVADHGGNWLESRLCRLGGEFAGIVRVEVPAAQQAALLAALPAVPGLHITVQPGHSPAAAAFSRHYLTIVGSDRPGIVRDISRVLAQAGVNVEEFTSEITSAPMSGEPLFQAAAMLALPAGCDLGALKTELEMIAADLQVDASFVDDAFP